MKRLIEDDAFLPLIREMHNSLKYVDYCSRT